MNNEFAPFEDIYEVLSSVTTEEVSAIKSPRAGDAIIQILQPRLKELRIAFAAAYLNDIFAFMISRNGHRRICFATDLDTYSRIATALHMIGHIRFNHSLDKYLGLGSDEKNMSDDEAKEKGTVWEFRKKGVVPGMDLLDNQANRWAANFVNTHFMKSGEINDPLVQTGLQVLQKLEPLFLAKSP